MKKYILITIPVVLICTLGLIFLSSQDANKSVSDRKTPLVSSMTRSIEIPNEVSFAGETIKLDRYDLHERYDREINSFTYFHSTTLLLIKRANRLFPIIEPILKANGIPDDFKYLAVIESSLDVRAVSPAKAAGLWQLLAGTAKQYGLEVTPEVDERFSVTKSTEAACRYLKDAYNRYGNWSSAAISYNAGMGRVSGEIDKQMVDEGIDLWLVEESSRYFFRMLAIKSIFESPYKYGFILTEDQLYKPIEFKQVEVTESIPDLAAFAQYYDITYAQLKDFNSWLRDRKLTIGRQSASSYTIDMPIKSSLYYMKGEKVKVHNKKWITE